MKLFAFWKYDLFPYCVGGEVLSMDKKGNVEALGRGYWWKPFKLVPLKHGKKIQEKIKVLEDEYRKAQKQLRAEYDQKLKELWETCDE